MWHRLILWNQKLTNDLQNAIKVLKTMLWRLLINWRTIYKPLQMKTLCTSVKGNCWFASVFLKKKWYTKNKQITHNMQTIILNHHDKKLKAHRLIVHCHSTFTLFVNRHTFWYLPQKTIPAGPVHSGASHKDTGSQSPEVDRNVCCRKANSRHVHAPSLSLRKGGDQSELIFDKTREKQVDGQKTFNTL